MEIYLYPPTPPNWPTLCGQGQLYPYCLFCCHLCTKPDPKRFFVHPSSKPLASKLIKIKACEKRQQQQQQQDDKNNIDKTDGTLIQLSQKTDNTDFECC
jgi:hypothetical protein